MKTDIQCEDDEDTQDIPVIVVAFHPSICIIEDEIIEGFALDGAEDECYDASEDTEDEITFNDYFLEELRKVAAQNKAGWRVNTTLLASVCALWVCAICIVLI